MNGNAYVTGLTHANGFPVVNGIQSTRKGYPDAFVSEVNATGSSLYFSTYLGGSIYDEAASIAVDSLGNAYLAGHTQSADFPLANAYQITYGGGDADALVAQIHVSPITLSLLSLTFANQNVGSTSVGKNVTVTNNGSLPLQITGVTVTGLNGGDFLQTNTCATALTAGRTCTITVTFAPSATGARTATLNVAADNSGSPPQIVSLTGTGGVSSVAVTPTLLSFGNQQVNTTSVAQVVTLSNTGSTALTISIIRITGTNSVNFAQTNTCGTSLAAGSNCLIRLTFKPTAAGARSAALSITDSDPTSPQTVPLSGTGVAPVASVLPATLTFSSPLNVTSAAQAVTVSNPGTWPLTISSIGITGTNSGDFAQTNNCGSSVAAGANCTISVTFTPTAAGARSATLAVTDNASGSPHKVSLKGTGIAPVVSLSSTSLSFGKVRVGATSSLKTVTLKNTGTATLAITSIGITGTNSGDFAQTNNCGSSVAAGASCTIAVTFTPTATGTRSAALAVTDNASNSPQQVSLQGTGK